MVKQERQGKIMELKTQMTRVDIHTHIRLHGILDGIHALVENLKFPVDFFKLAVQSIKLLLKLIVLPLELLLSW